MKFGSLFAGIGGFDLGLEHAGMQCAWQVEIDDYCSRVLAKHWPKVKRYGDIRECGAHNLAAVDLICGGFPCQPHSVAGKRKGKTDDRNLWPEYRRIVAELRPRWVVGENVPGIITTMLDEVLSDLEGEGYAVTAITVPAVAFDAPHRRDRVWIIAYADEYSGNARRTASEGQQWTTRVADGGEIVANAEGEQSRQPNRQSWWEGSRTGGRAGGGSTRSSNTEVVADTNVDSTERGFTQPDQRTISTGIDGARYSAAWAVEPDVGRVANGVPHRVDRLRALGNAVVPQVAEWIGNVILALDSKRNL